jgi:hypothetical protein
VKTYQIDSVGVIFDGSPGIVSTSVKVFVEGAHSVRGGVGGKYPLNWVVTRGNSMVLEKERHEPSVAGSGDDLSEEGADRRERDFEDSLRDGERMSPK